MFRFFLFIGCLFQLAASKPDLLLAQLYHQAIAVEQYWVSEKLDGVRAYWNGRQLLTRGGQVLAAPRWFVADFPKVPLDGELWMGRQKFAETLSIISKSQPVDAEWQQIQYHIFELPDAAGSFTARIAAMQSIVQQQQSRYLRQIPQFRVADKAALFAKLKQLEQQGAEGLMLHHQDAKYKTGRTADLLKLKSYQDTEAEVIGYRPGKGKYLGMLGALVVKTPEGKTFALGTGFTDQQRQQPPAIGTQVTYRYNGLTKTGLPRFARFVRVRENH